MKWVFVLLKFVEWLKLVNWDVPTKRIGPEWWSESIGNLTFSFSRSCVYGYGFTKSLKFR